MRCLFGLELGRREIFALIALAQYFCDRQVTRKMLKRRIFSDDDCFCCSMPNVLPSPINGIVIVSVSDNRLILATQIRRNQYVSGTAATTL